MKYLFLYFFLCITEMYAVLDGLVTPIYLENRYTFTNYEFARGHVYFKNGFDCPVNGTIILSLLNPVEGVIRAQRSTLRLRTDLVLGDRSSIRGECFIELRELLLQITSDQTLSSSDRWFFPTNGEVRGVGSIINPAEGAIIFLPGASLNYFSNIILQGVTNQNFLGLSGRPNKFVLNNMGIVLGTSWNIPGLEVSLQNLTVVSGQRGSVMTFLNKLRFDSFSDMIVGPGITLKLQLLDSLETTGGLVLNNAVLEYYATPTSTFIFSSAPGRPVDGKITFRGPSEIKADASTFLYLTRNSIFEFESGGRLSLAPGTNLRLY